MAPFYLVDILITTPPNCHNNNSLDCNQELIKVSRKKEKKNYHGCTVRNPSGSDLLRKWRCSGVYSKSDLLQLTSFSSQNIKYQNICSISVSNNQFLDIYKLLLTCLLLLFFAIHPLNTYTTRRETHSQMTRRLRHEPHSFTIWPSVF